MPRKLVKCHCNYCGVDKIEGWYPLIGFEHCKTCGQKDWELTQIPTKSYYPEDDEAEKDEESNGNSDGEEFGFF